MNSFLLVAAVILALGVAAQGMPQRSKGKDYPLRLQPELDNFSISDYLRNDRLLDLQINCVLEKGPCDTIGRWVKPRVGAAVTQGKCLECTEKQTEGIKTVMSAVKEKRPEAFQQIVAKYSAAA